MTLDEKEENQEDPLNEKGAEEKERTQGAPLSVPFTVK